MTPDDVVARTAPGSAGATNASSKGVTNAASRSVTVAVEVRRDRAHAADALGARAGCGVKARKPGTFEWARLAEWIAYQESVLNQDQVESLRQWWHGYETRSIVEIEPGPDIDQYDQGGLLGPISWRIREVPLHRPSRRTRT